MTAGKLTKDDLWEAYYATLLKAYNGMRVAFKKSGLSQDQIAENLGVDKALVSKRLHTRENLTLRTLSFMASAMGYRLEVTYTPFAEVKASITDHTDKVEASSSRNDPSVQFKRGVTHGEPEKPLVETGYDYQKRAA